MSASPGLITRSIDAVACGRDLSMDDAAAVLSEIMAGNTSDVQIAAFLIALRTKGETVEELAGLARTMRARAAQVAVNCDRLLDTAGTGGGRGTFNVSTTAALIAAGAGCTLAKHGNRSATGRSGSADVLEALGARIDLTPAAVARCIERAGFGFMFAPAHHRATRHVAPVRKQLAVRTIFNFLGPLTNPAGATRQLIGVSDIAYLETVAGALARLGTEHAFVVCGEDGIDELSTSAPTRVVEVRAGKLRRRTITPEDVSLRRAPAEAILGGDPQENARVTLRILEGERGPARDLAVINAGAAIYVGGAAETLEAGVRAAERAIDSGRAAASLDRFLTMTHELALELPEMNALQPILAGTRVDVRQRARELPVRELERVAAERIHRGGVQPFADAIAAPGMSVIAEHKRRSPSAGTIRAGLTLTAVVQAYDRGGAAAVSILTNHPHFGGSLDDLRTARELTALPILRKDFIIDPYQIAEACAAGADAILLIAAAVSPRVLSSLHAYALDLQLTPLVEVHGERELEVAMEVGARIVGINNRDLTTLRVDRRRTFELLPRVLGAALVVAESGFSRRAELDELSAAGVDGVLVGEALMRSEPIEDACLRLAR